MNILLRFLPFLRPWRLHLAGTLVLSVLFSLLSAASIYVVLPIMRLIFRQDGAPTAPAESGDGSLGGIEQDISAFIGDLVLVDGSVEGSLLNLCLVVLLLYVLKNGVKFASGVLNSVIQQGVMKGIRDDLFARAVRLPVSFYNDLRGGDLISIVTNEVGTINAAIVPTFVRVTRDPIQIVILLLLLIALSPMLTLVAFSTTIFTVLLLRALRRSVRKYSLRMQSALQGITARLQEAFQNIRIIKAFAIEAHETSRFMAETDRYTRSSVKHAIVNNLTGPIGEIISVVAIAVVIFYGGLQVLEGTLGAEELITFLLLLFSIMSPIVGLLQVPTQMARGVVAAERVDAILTEPTEPDGTEELRGPVTDAITLRDVRFAYGEGPDVLRGITLEIRRGERLALVGPSGGGKSTLMDLIIRFYDPVAGEIELDGVDVRRIRLEEYRSLFGIVTQEPLLFHDTIRANILCGATDVAEDRVIEAARIANAHDFITGLPEQYDTVVGDRGLRLSGGQRQRIAIARAILRDPQILLFDEATSALDNESEILVQRAIDQVLVGRTAVIIAHRLSTIRNADRIVVIDDGEIQEIGTHEELLAARGGYAALHDYSRAE